MTLQELNPSGMAAMIRNYNSQIPQNTNVVWMLCFGILDFIDLEIYPQCYDLQCRSHLLSFSVKDKWHEVESKVKEVMDAVNKFKKDLLCGFWSNSMLLIMPPMQMAVLNGEAFKDHEKLHTVAKEKNFFICNKETFNLLKRFYSQLSRVWSVDIGKLLEGIYQRPMSFYMTRFWEKNLLLFDGGVGNVCQFGVDWKIMMEEVVNIALKKHSLALSESRISSHLISLPFISLIESSSSIGKTFRCNLQKIPKKEDHLFKHVVVIGNQLPAELDELCHQLSINVILKRVTFDEAGMALIQKYQEQWPRGTLWVILSDLIHLTTLKDMEYCVHHKCKDRLKVYTFGTPEARGKRMISSISEINFISKVKKFSETLTDSLGEGSAVFLPPVTPVFMLHASDTWQHKDLHKWIEYCGKAVPVLIGRKSLKRRFNSLKHAWLEMLKSCLGKYPALMEILKLYEQSNEDWIKTLGNFLVHFATARKDHDDDDAVFSDTGKED